MPDSQALLFILRFRDLTYSFAPVSDPSATLFTVSLLSVLHAIRVAATVTSSPAYHAYSIPHYILAVICLAWGGSTAVTIALANPPEWIYKNENIVTYLTVAMALYHSRQLRSLAAMPVIRSLCQFADGLCRAHAMARFAVDPVLRLAKNGPAPVVPAIAAGVFASVGGGLLDRCFGVSRSSWRLAAPPIGALTGPEILLAALCSSVYTLLLTGSALSRNQALAVACWMSALGLPTISLVRRIYYSASVGAHDALDELSSRISLSPHKKLRILNESAAASAFAMSSINSARRQSAKSPSARLAFSDPESERDDGPNSSMLSDIELDPLPMPKRRESRRVSAAAPAAAGLDSDAGVSPAPPAKRPRATRVSRSVRRENSDANAVSSPPSAAAPALRSRRMRSKSRTLSQ